MPRLGSMIVDGLACLLVGIALAAVVVGYGRNLPDPGTSPALMAERAPAWMDPETTGSITPAPGVASRGAAAQSLFPAGEADRPSRIAGDAWVSPPRR